MKMYDILDGLASNQDAVSSVFFRAVRDGPDLHCIFLEHNSSQSFQTVQVEMEELCLKIWMPTEGNTERETVQLPVIFSQG